MIAEEQRLAAQSPTPDSYPRGRKRQAVDNLEHTRAGTHASALLRDGCLDYPRLRDLPAAQQHTVLDGLVHTLTTYREELQAAVDQQTQSTPATAAPPHDSSDLPLSPVAAGADVPVPDSASMSLTSSSTSPPNARPLQSGNNLFSHLTISHAHDHLP